MAAARLRQADQFIVYHKSRRRAIAEEEDEGNEEGRYFLGAQESTKEGCV